MFIDLNLEPGGSVISIVDLAKKLADQGFGSILIKPRGNLWDGIVNLGDLNVFQVLSYPWVQHRSLDNHLLRKIKRKIKSVINFGSEIKIFLLVKFYQVEFVHINTVNFQIGHKAARWADVKLVWHIREVLDLGHNTAFHNPEFAKLMISSADLVIGNSKATCSVWADILDRPVELAYNGISPSFLNQNRVPLFLKDIEEKEAELMSKVTASKFLVLGGAGSIGQSVTKEIFKKLSDSLHLINFADIAIKYLNDTGYKPHLCDSEGEVGI